MVIRSPPLLAGSVLHCGYGVATGRCLLAQFGSYPTAYRHDKPPPQDELLLRGSRPRAAVDWQPVKSEHRSVMRGGGSLPECLKNVKA